jgi:hypothetical protein
MAALLRSSWVPLVGIALLWGAYAGFLASRWGKVAPPTSRPHPAATSAIAKARPPSVRRSSGSVSKKTEKPVGVPATGGAAVGGLSQADEELLKLVEGMKPKDPEGLDRLRKFVEAHPEDANARGFLVLRLFQERSRTGSWDEAEVREHLGKLQEILPHQGLPDLLLARVESLAGQRDLARRHLLEGAEKDLSWFPDDEVLRLRVASDLEKGFPPSKIAARTAFSRLTSPQELRDLYEDFLVLKGEEGEDGDWKRVPPPADPDALDLHRQTSRALLHAGKAMQEGGPDLVYNLMGSIIIDKACKSLEEAGDLQPDEAALRERVKFFQNERQIIADLHSEILFADPEISRQYLRDQVEIGGSRAALRAGMVYLSRRTED